MVKHAERTRPNRTIDERLAAPRSQHHAVQEMIDRIDELGQAIIASDDQMTN